MKKLISIIIVGCALAVTTDDIYDNSYALIIGIDKYENVSNLDYAVDDAKSIKSLLIEQFKFSPDNITLLINEKATYTKIKKSLSYVTRKASENDRILIFFAGHGETIDLPESGEMGFLIPVDGEKDDLYATSLEMDDLRKVSSLSQAKHILYLVDACYGGLAATNTRGLEASTPGFIDKITRDKSRQIITAGGRGEKVIEKAEWGHSAFTLNILRGLKDWMADINTDGIITAEELGLFLKNRVTKDSENLQTPQVRRFTSHEGEFVFFGKDVKLSDNNNDMVNVDKKVIRDLLSQIDNIDEIISGCTDSKAENYDPDALKDDKSCVYSDLPGGIDLLLNNYLPDSQEIDVLFKNMFESDPSNGLAGFQFNVTGATLLDAFGGVAEGYGFMISSSASLVIGFSLEAAMIPVNNDSDILVTLSLLDVSKEICLTEVILAGLGGANIQTIEANSCLNIK
jgi:hypothetical protein